MSQTCQQRKYPSHSITSSASARSVGIARLSAVLWSDFTGSPEGWPADSSVSRAKKTCFAPWGGVHWSPTRISRGASQREAVDGIDGVLREARRWSAKVIAAVGIIPVPLYFLGRNENVFPVLPALRIDRAVDRFDFGRVAVRIVATAERRIIRHVPRRIKPPCAWTSVASRPALERRSLQRRFKAQSPCSQLQNSAQSPDDRCYNRLRPPWFCCEVAL
jgi:hypothetical protein